jgi:hypothetical protein
MSATSPPSPVAGQRADRVRAHTQSGVQERLDQQLAERIAQLAADGPDAISRRLAELDRESDTERVLEINASALALTGLAVGDTVNRRWLLLPAVVLPFLLQHGIQGWCPPIAVLRRLGVRTREIDAERYALKAIRGDFQDIAHSPGQQVHAARALQAVRA